MKFAFGLAVFLWMLLPLRPASASTLNPPSLTISKGGKAVKTVPIFDKWTQGATLAVADLGTDGIPELLIGAGPGSAPEIRLLRQDGSLINKFLAFDKAVTKGVIVGAKDMNGDGKNEIIAATGPKTGKFVRVFDGYGKLLHDWHPIPDGFGSILTAATVSEETDMAFSVPAPSFADPERAEGKKIMISLSEQRLYAYENGYLAATYLISSGTKAHPTKPGEYKVKKKFAVKRYVGPGYNLPNAHWNTLFSDRGEYFHEAYWHDKFGQPMSHGCINMRKEDAKFIYDWSETGTPVIIKE